SCAVAPGSAGVPPALNGPQLPNTAGETPALPALSFERDRLRAPGLDALAVFHRRREAHGAHGADGRVVETEARVALQHFDFSDISVFGDQRRKNNHSLRMLLHRQRRIVGTR